MDEGFRTPTVSYPEGALDVTACRDELEKSAAGAVGRAHELLRQIEIDPHATLILTSGSPEYESLLCRDGLFRIAAGSWYRNSDKAHPGVLAARFPRLAEYLRTRTEAYIAYRLHELRLIGSEHDRRYIESEVATLQQQLAEF